MIVKMKKVTVITTENRKKETLKSLRQLGVLHIETQTVESEELARLQEERQLLKDALPIIERFSDDKASPKEVKSFDTGLAAAQYVLSLIERKNSLADQNSRSNVEIQRIKPWGDFDPAGFAFLDEKGFSLRLYELATADLESIDSEIRYVVINKDNKTARIAVIGEGEIPGESFTLPETSLDGLYKSIEENKAALLALEEEFAASGFYKEQITSTLSELEKEIEFHSISLNMGVEAVLTFLTGFIPVDKTEDLKEHVKKESLGLALDDPKEDEFVPTLIKNPKWVEIIKPVFNILGTIPGYKEFDISFWFLLFFTPFFAMIIGDAGYGAILLLGTLFARIKMKKAPSAPFTLMFLMSIATIAWGAITGTWFGSDVLANMGILKEWTIPFIASFPDKNSSINTTQFIMNLCFIIGGVQLTIAHLKNFIKLFPSAVAFAEPGWITMLWGLFFLVQNIVLGQPMNPLTMPLIIIGFALVNVFCEQAPGRNFFKGILLGLAGAPLKLLDSISAFSDIISYVRLFAVGLASVEVAKAFNAMAGGIGFDDFTSGLITTLILVAGHMLNIMMGALSVLVHGVRLNMLEFSGHLGMEWSGRVYKPFKE